MPFLLYPTAILALNCLFLPESGTGRASNPEIASAEEVITKVSHTLGSLEGVSYKYTRELNYPSEGYYHKLQTDTYLDFTSADELAGFRYQADDQNLFQVNNGAEIFVLDKRSKTTTINRRPGLSSVENLSFLYNSPVTLRNVLPSLLADAAIPKTLTDTLIHNTGYYAVRFELKGRAIDNLGGYRKLTEENTTKYQLIVDRDTYFPVEVLQTNGLNGDFIKTSFTDVDLSPTLPTEASWYYSSYLGKYAPQEAESARSLIEIGKQSPAWGLPVFGTGDTVELNKYKGKVVLLEFWNRNCGYCIAAVPKLNELHAKYRGRHFQLLAINVFDPPELIEQFRQKTKPTYPILYHGETVANTYGISYYPAVVLINKEGSILYAGHFDPERLEELIRRNL
jgi:thiol-disulfide isomerase/thioredoxin